jgi:hypothetical protein
MDYSKLRTSLVLFSGILACGTFGYAIVDQMPLYDAFYKTIITISTVGFSEIRPLSPAGRAITIFVIVTGISLGTYTLGLFVRIAIKKACDCRMVFNPLPSEKLEGGDVALVIGKREELERLRAKLE